MCRLRYAIPVFPDEMRTTDTHSRSRVAYAGLALALLAALAAALAGFGSRWGWWGFGTGFTVLKYAAYLAILAALVSAVGIAQARPGTPRRGFGAAVAGLVVAAVVFGVPWQWRRQARAVPPIHDITTDTRDPPEFVAVLPLRAEAPNPAEYGGDSIAALQREGYPELYPAALPLRPEEAFRRALAVAREMGWEIVAADSASGRIEATDQTFWFGFRDDVVVRVRGVAGGSWVDVRSVSRVGGSDVGTNARRIRRYLERLREQRDA